MEAASQGPVSPFAAVFAERFPMMPYSIHGRSISLSLLLLASLASTVQADLFHYKDGRIISGKVLGQPAEVEIAGNSTTVWTVEIDPGVYIQVLKSELVLGSGYEALSKDRAEYAQLAAQAPRTVEGQRELVVWCLKHGLADLAKAHQLATVDIAPDDNAVRVAADYMKDRNGRWQKKEVIMGQQLGKVRQGRLWRFPESIAHQQAEEELAKQTVEATKDLRRWHNVLSSRNANPQNKNYQDAVLGIQQLDNPLVVGTISDYLLDSRKEIPAPLRMMYTEILARFQNFETARVLTQVSMQDADPQVRARAMDLVASYGAEVAIPVLTGYLGNADNTMVNRAAEGLGRLSAQSAILPLINAITTTHSMTVGSEATNASPTSGSFSTGGQKTISVPIENASVRNTLTQLTNQSFGYDRAAWIHWYASQYAAPASDLRRDP
ncbi:hypothetical protein Q31a_05650 [Aureliella helgolandensis]|uniref:HEAT repeat domain-containing protein n=2 Tax=Aureliella helgolandensis TaxID=2527968 RepID=A0A518G0Z9_9BACT|nr:hypothetical protein Q31a_05650 [Aureliella helgolandensis]